METSDHMFGAGSPDPSPDLDRLPEGPYPRVMRFAIAVTVAVLAAGVGAAGCGLLNAVNNPPVGLATCDDNPAGPCRCEADGADVSCASDDGVCACENGFAFCDAVGGDCVVETAGGCFTGACRCEDDGSNGGCTCDSRGCSGEDVDDRVLATQNDDGCRGACSCDASGCSREGDCIANVDNRPCEDDVGCRAAAGGVELSPSATCDTTTDCGADQAIACVETTPNSFQCVPAAQDLTCANNESRFEVPLVDGGEASATRIAICVPNLVEQYVCVDGGGTLSCQLQPR